MCWRASHLTRVTKSPLSLGGARGVGLENGEGVADGAAMYDVSSALELGDTSEHASSASSMTSNDAGHFCIAADLPCTY